MTSNFLDVAYVPFVWGWTNGMVSGTTYPANGFYNATLYFARAYVTIGLEIYSNGNVCFDGAGHLWPVQLESGLSAALRECKAEILTDIIDGTPIYLGCNYTLPLVLNHLNVSFT